MSAASEVLVVGRRDRWGQAVGQARWNETFLLLETRAGKLSENRGHFADIWPR